MLQLLHRAARVTLFTGKCNFRGSYEEKKKVYNVQKCEIDTDI